MALLFFMCALLACLALSAADLVRGDPANYGKVLDFSSLGATADDMSLTVCEANAQIFQDALNALTYGDMFVVPGSVYCVQGGIEVKGMRGGTVRIDGELRFQDDRDAWPKNEDGTVKEAIMMYDIEDVVFTSSPENAAAGKRGILNGQGRKWWGAIRMLKHGEDRPRLWHIIKSKNIHIEYLLLLDSAYWSFFGEQSDGLRIQWSDVSARITELDRHDLYDLTAFNTDGFDFSGRNIWISDCNVWCQDDCFTVKDDPVASRDILVERVNCSGLGLVVGSIGQSKVQNVTFRNAYLHHSYKGIYLKSRWNDLGPQPDDVYIKDILFEHIVIEKPEQWAIWLGPAQQTGQPCSLLWPNHHGECKMSAAMTWSNIVLRNITVIDPKQSPGVLFGNASNPITGLVFDNVVVKNPKKDPFENFWFCQDVEMTVSGSEPVPKCV